MYARKPGLDPLSRPALACDILLVKRRACDVLYWQTGDAVPFSGMFGVEALHAVPRVILLRKGDTFPGCSQCSESLFFWGLARRDIPTGLRTDVRKLPVIQGDAKTSATRPEATTDPAKRRMLLRALRNLLERADRIRDFEKRPTPEHC